jgi:hypothetical protein
MMKRRSRRAGRGSRHDEAAARRARGHAARAALLHRRFHPAGAVINNSEGAGAATIEPPAAASWATLLSRHILRDGEVIILLLKPSLWFIPLSSLWVIAVVCCVMAGIFVFDFDDKYRALNTLTVVETGLFLIAGRLMWAVLQWVARLYVLTDQRILRISGVFNVQIFDCPLRKVARARRLPVARERIVGVGSIEIIPMDENLPVATWQTVARPKQVHEQVVATINKARQGGCGL